MRVTLSVDTNNPYFPKNGISIVQAELAKRMEKALPNAMTSVKSSSLNSIKCDGMKEAQQKIAKSLIEEMFEEADQWLVAD